MTPLRPRVRLRIVLRDPTVYCRLRRGELWGPHRDRVPGRIIDLRGRLGWIVNDWHDGWCRVSFESGGSHELHRGYLRRVYT